MFLNLVTGGGSSLHLEKSVEYWKERLPAGIVRRFGSVALTQEEASNGLSIRQKIFGEVEGEEASHGGTVLPESEDDRIPWQSTDHGRIR